jgi:hypothetical protein
MSVNGSAFPADSLRSGRWRVSAPGTWTLSRAPTACRASATPPLDRTRPTPQPKGCRFPPIKCRTADTFRLDSFMAAPRAFTPCVPADADHFCVQCGYPFRSGYRATRCCSAPSACGRRLRDARTLDGLEKRLRAAREADPYEEFGGAEIAHGWVRLHYPELDLDEWDPRSDYEGAPALTPASTERKRGHAR